MLTASLHYLSLKYLVKILTTFETYFLAHPLQCHFAVIVVIIKNFDIFIYLL